MTGVRPERTMFLYWGRRGGLVRFTLEAAKAALASDLLEPTISVSTANERFDDFAGFGDRLFPIRTYQRGSGALLSAWRLPELRASLKRRLVDDGITTAVILLPHVWTPLTNDVLRRAGVRTYTMVHDVDPHPGDNTAAVINWCHRDLHKSDRLITLSEAVTVRLMEKYDLPRSKILTLFHPAFEKESPIRADIGAAGGPVRLLFLGRIMPYKGLGLLIDAVEQLRNRGVFVHLGVYGEGDISALEPRLSALGCTVVNRWLSDAEIDSAVAGHDIMVLPYIEASQSGVASLAIGQGLPIVATPVGGLREQVQHGVNGVLAEAVDAAALARALHELALNTKLRSDLASGAKKARAASSMALMIEALARDIIANR